MDINYWQFFKTIWEQIQSHPKIFFKFSKLLYFKQKLTKPKNSLNLRQLLRLVFTPSVLTERTTKVIL